MKLTFRTSLKSVQPDCLLICVTGFRVGRQLAERYTANRARTGEPLEVIKFICKEFWVAVFRKQVCFAQFHAELK